jgi:hypothetical protein
MLLLPLHTTRLTFNPLAFLQPFFDTPLHTADGVRSLYKTIIEGGADATFPLVTASSRLSPRNGITLANYMVLPTPGGRLLAQRWWDTSSVAALKEESAQDSLRRLWQYSTAFEVCCTVTDCHKVRAAVKGKGGATRHKPLVRQLVPVARSGKVVKADQ